MKKIALMLFLALLFNSNVASAHSKLETSTPKAGETITGKLPEISLTFNTTIEESSKFILLHEGKTEVPVSDIKIDGSTLTGKIPDELKNGSYTVEWDIVGADTHVVKDSMNFNVQRETAAAEDKSPQTQEEEKPQTQEPKTSSEQEKTSSSLPIIIGGVLVVLVIVFLISMFRKKK
ncbi:copper resistance CopC family protein [Metabacillus sp. FJAT-52054]|uniref:Copper resistance CopC family protein n=1 Tax=Metabacillus sediminis TaxID=3117746 RepID=A0ABZ2NEQ3_9BACI